MNNNSKYGFNLSNNKYVKYLLIDGYDVGDLKLDGVMIKVCLDNEGKAISWFGQKEREYLGILDCREELLKAAELLKEAIETKNFSSFIYPKTEIFNKNNDKVEDFSNNKYGLLEFFNMTDISSINIPSIISVYDIENQLNQKVKMTEFEMTVESLKKVNFIKDFSKIKVKLMKK